MNVGKDKGNLETFIVFIPAFLFILAYSIRSQSCPVKRGCIAWQCSLSLLGSISGLIRSCADVDPIAQEFQPRKYLKYNYK